MKHNTNPTAGKTSYIRKAVLCAQDPSEQLTQLDWLGNLSSLLDAAADCFVTGQAGVYHENLREWNTSGKGERKLPGVCSLMWREDVWEIHLLVRDFLEVIDGLFADGRLNAERQQDCLPEGLANDFEVYLAGDFKVQRHSFERPAVYYELSYTPATMGKLRLFALVDQEGLGNVRTALRRYGIRIKQEE